MIKHSLPISLCAAFALLGPAACKSGAQASHGPDGAHAEAHADVNAQASSDDDNRYHADVLVRTGIRIDRDLVTACALEGADAYFAFDSTKVTSRSHDVLAKLAGCVTDGPLRGKELELVGYTDPRGSDAYNKELGLTRAESVAGCLREHGVAVTQLEINSVGEQQASPDSEEWPFDRRVEIHVKRDGGAG